MIDGFADLGFVQAAVVLDDVITKADLIRWGWAAETKFLNDRQASEAVRLRKAFEYNGKYYRMDVTSKLLSPFEKPYWTESGGSNDLSLSLIQAALSAPVVKQTAKTAYYGHWVTTGNERVDLTVWHHKTDAKGAGTYEIENIPGVGYKYKMKNFIEDPPPSWPNYGSWAAAVVYITQLESEHITFEVHLPKCELGSDTCIQFIIKTEVEPLTGRFTSAYLSFRGFHFPKKIRRLPLPRFQPRTKTEGISCYVMSKSHVKTFIDTLYTKSIYDQFQTMLYGDGAGNILSLKWFYGVRPHISTTRSSKVTLGNLTLDKVVSPIFEGDFVQVYLGYINVPREYDDYRDYVNVRYQAYIPMVGIIDLDPAEVVGKNLHLLYTVNLTDGSAVVTLAVSNYTDEGKPALPKKGDWYDTPQIVFTSSITYGYEIPLHAEAIRDASLLVGQVVSGAVTGGGAGALAGAPGAAIGAIGGAVSAVMGGGGAQSTYSSGSLTPNSNVMGDFTPKLIRTVTKDVSGDISQATGLPCGKVVKVGDASGYLKAAMVYGTPSTTMQHADEIENMLKEGIRIS